MLTVPDLQSEKSNDNEACCAYVIVSQTGTILSRIIKLVTRSAYNHVSVSLHNDLSTMYSFGRINPYNPVVGGLVIESPGFGTFARFKNTEVVILKVQITPGQKEKLRKRLEKMYSKRKLYHYNYIGLFLAAIHIHYKKKNCFYCSEFVREVLVRSSILNKESFEKIVHPMRFLNIDGLNVIYTGKLRQFASKIKETREEMGG